MLISEGLPSDEASEKSQKKIIIYISPTIQEISQVLLYYFIKKHRIDLTYKIWRSLLNKHLLKFYITQQLARQSQPYNQALQANFTLLKHKPTRHPIK